MIRVNLLPQKREQKRAAVDTNQGWILVVLGVVVAEIIGLFLFHQVKREELAKQLRTNAELTSQIDQIKKQVANHADVKSQLEVLRAREDAIAKLQQARTGPTAVMLEVSRVLTAGHGPTVDPDVLAQLRRDNPTSVYNPGWDPRRLWLTAFTEGDRLVKIDGLARDGDDVSELARRLSLSVYFAEVKLLPASKTTEAGLDLIRFQLQAKARY